MNLYKKLSAFNMKLINLIQKFPYIIESYVFILKLFVTKNFLMIFPIYFGIYSTTSKILGRSNCSFTWCYCAFTCY